MPRQRTNDPLGTSDNPHVATDPDRINQRLTEFHRRISYIEESYRLCSNGLGPDVAYNRSLARLRSAVRRNATHARPLERAHPEIEIAINKFALDHSCGRTGSEHPELTEDDVKVGVLRAAAELKMRRGAGRNTILRRHVEGLMALIQQFSGKPVLVVIQKDNIYDPQAVSPCGEVLLNVLSTIEPKAQVCTIASMVKKARAQYAGKPMRFEEFFPFYGDCGEMLRGEANPHTGARLQLMGLSSPIYFP